MSAARFCTISGVCRWVPPTPYADALPITSLPSRCGLAALPAPLVPEAATTTTSGVTSPAATAGARARVDDRRVAAGYGDPSRAAQHVALARAARAGRRARCRRGRRRRTAPTAPASREPEVGAAVDDQRARRRARPPGPPTGRAAAPGRPRRGRRASPPRSRSSTRSASGVRCGWSAPRVSPALRPGGQGADLDRGVAEQQAQQLAAGVPAGAGDRHLSSSCA